MSRRGDRIRGRRAHGGVLLIPCLLHDAYRDWFLADTGAARTMISQAIADEIGLDLTSPIRQERIVSVHQSARVPVVSLHSLQVGMQRLTAIEALVLSLPSDLRLDGLLGVNFFTRFRTTFEFDQDTLVLR
jgi:clan AA aspartic protease (TIGR02281 family)